MFKNILIFMIKTHFEFETIFRTFSFKFSDFSDKEV